MRHRPSCQKHECHFGHLQHGTTMIRMPAQLLRNQAIVMYAFFIKDFAEGHALRRVLLATVRLRVPASMADAIQHSLSVDAGLWT